MRELDILAAFTGIKNHRLKEKKNFSSDLRIYTSLRTVTSSDFREACFLSCMLNLQQMNVWITRQLLKKLNSILLHLPWPLKTDYSEGILCGWVEFCFIAKVRLRSGGGAKWQSADLACVRS